MKVLEIKNIEKKFGETKIFSEFSLDVNEGEIVSIVGPSGRGKSTLLRLINQLELLDGGNINICGQDLVKTYKDGKAIYNDKDILKNISLNVGMVFQEFNLFPYLSVIENVVIPLTKVLNIKKKESNVIGMGLLKKMNLEEKAKFYPYQLSGGQKQRVAIARTLALNPKIICFDEPTSSLDNKLKKEVIKIMQEIANEKRTILIVTHEVEVIKNISDKVITL